MSERLDLGCGLSHPLRERDPHGDQEEERHQVPNRSSPSERRSFCDLGDTIRDATGETVACALTRFWSSGSVESLVASAGYPCSRSGDWSIEMQLGGGEGDLETLNFSTEEVESKDLRSGDQRENPEGWDRVTHARGERDMWAQRTRRSGSRSRAKYCEMRADHLVSSNLRGWNPSIVLLRALRPACRVAQDVHAKAFLDGQVVPSVLSVTPTTLREVSYAGMTPGFMDNPHLGVARPTRKIGGGGLPRSLVCGWVDHSNAGCSLNLRASIQCSQIRPQCWGAGGKTPGRG